MENDSIRASGTDTLIDVWVEGKLRAISITKAAIETFIGASSRADLTDEGRCEFVRTHLPQLVTAVKTKLRATDPTADMIVIDGGELGGAGDRRKTERRKINLPPEKLPHGERRRGDRRRSSRRQSPTRNV